MMKEPSVYIILVNYNGYEDTVECIKSIKKIKYSNYRIVLVENASNDRNRIQTDKYINENAIVMYADENEGFSSGNNIGIKFAIDAGAEYVLLLNNDTIVAEDFLDHLINKAESESDVGIVTGDIFFYYDKTRLWYSNGSYNRKTGITQMCSYTGNDEENVSFACGCLMLIKTEVINDIGLLEDLFFLYSEDTEYCCRAVDAGWKIIWTKKSKIYHKISASTGENSDFQQYYLTRNNLILLRKYGKIRIYGYIRRFWCCLKDKIKGRCNLKPVWWAYIDFIKRNEGKTDRY